MKPITPKIVQNFSIEERILYKSGLLGEDKTWTNLAKEYAIELFLNSKKEDLVKLGKEIIEEEREEMFKGMMPFAGVKNTKQE